MRLTWVPGGKPPGSRCQHRTRVLVTRTNRPSSRAAPRCRDMHHSGCSFTTSHSRRSGSTRPRDATFGPAFTTPPEGNAARTDRPATGATFGPAFTTPPEGNAARTDRPATCCAANAHEDDVNARTRTRRCHRASATTPPNPSDTNETTPPTRHTCWLRPPPS
jgi:hypothetical protein